MSNVLRAHAEQQFAEELEEIKKVDTYQRPPNWLMSPWAVVTYILGGKLKTDLTSALNILEVVA
jgi:hypothetical protein